MGQILSSIGLSPVSCSLYNVTESFEHLFFDCVYARKLWSIFLGSSSVWNCVGSVFWSEILVGYVEKFDSKLNTFWFALSTEILWTLLKDGNKEIFQEERRVLTEFNFELTIFILCLKLLWCFIFQGVISCYLCKKATC